MTNEQAASIYSKYAAAWRAIPDDERKLRLADAISEDVRYETPAYNGRGPALIIEDIHGFQAKFPGGHFDVGGISAHGDVALVTWILVQSDGRRLVEGHDYVRVADGKISHIVTFPPSVPL